MPVITLPDGAKREFDAPVTPAQIATDISPSFTKQPLQQQLMALLGSEQANYTG